MIKQDYDTCLIPQGGTAFAGNQYCCEAAESAELLPQLKESYPYYMDPAITSVIFGQTKHVCFLEITTTVIVDGRPQVGTTQRTELDFIGGHGWCDLFFDPKHELRDNIARFLNDFNEIDIMNCTDLFIPEECKRIDEYWRKHGVCPDPRGRNP